MKEINVSVYVTTYNHEKYLKYALDSVLMQQVNFNMEVLVGDDASTDRTTSIMREYEKKYPGFFTMIYREKNMYRDPNAIGNSRDLLEKCKGKYIIGLEGDDYWTDPYKLQKQFDFLENNPDYIAVAHNTTVVDQNNNPLEEAYPECKDDEYTIDHFLCGVFPGQYTTMMCRNYIKDTNINDSIMNRKLVPGDRLRAFVLCSYGKIKCIQETMSAYRHVTLGGSSYSATYKFDYGNWKNYYKQLMEYALEERAIPEKNKLVAQVLYIETLFSGIKNNYISKKNFILEYGNVKHKVKATMMFCHYYLKKNWYYSED